MTETLRQWMQDMTGPEDAWARQQYADLIQAALKVEKSNTIDQLLSGLAELHYALQVCGELTPDAPVV